MMRIGNRIGVWLYRVSEGRLPSGSTSVLMITTPGWRTATPRSTCVRYFENAEGFVVWGTGSGSKQDPDWFRNLRKAMVADVQIGARRLQCRPREFVDDERDAVWRDWCWPEHRKSRSTPREQAGRSRWRCLRQYTSDRRHRGQVSR